MSRSKPLAADAESEPHGDGSSRPSQSKKKRRSQKLPDQEPADSHQEDSSSDAEPPIPLLENLSLYPTPMIPSLLRGSSIKGIPIFVASLGNPKPYLNTLHSAGHTVLRAIAAENKYDAWRPYTGGSLAENSNTDFSFIRGYNKNGAALPTLWKCGAMMNASGPAVKKAWLKWKKENGFSDDAEEKPRLVIVHDELEKELGAVNVRTDPKASARGHNGLKSLMAALPNERFIRIGVGIGRPESRERDAVSNYVLRKMTAREAQALEKAALRVYQQIEEVYEGAVG